MVAFFIIYTQKSDERSNKVLKITISLFTPTRKVYAENAGADSEFPVGGRAWQGGVHGRGACPPSRYHEIRSMSGRYTSYWNAFLYTLSS